MITVDSIQLFHLRMPFRRKDSHALAERSQTSNIIVKITSREGVIGWGETIPRTYLTGESVESAAEFIEEKLAPEITGRGFAQMQDIKEAVASLIDSCDRARSTAALCGVELALLDAAGKAFNLSAGDILGDIVTNRIYYTAPIDAASMKKVKKRTWLFRLAGFRDFKVKVGTGDDLAVVRTVRKIAGPRALIRLDANCAWKPDEAIRNLREMSHLNISSIEQPVAADDIEGMRRVRRESGVRVMVDESMCTMEDARRLAEAGACDIFNVRLAKCGGMLACRRIIDFARENGIRCQLGCLVGETGILSAAERIFAGRFEGTAHHEFSFPRFLLQKDIVRNPVSVGYRGLGKVRPVERGLGVDVDENVLREFSTLITKG